MSSKQIDYSLYLVTDRQLLKDDNFFTAVEQAVKGGVSVVQLREKEICTREFYLLAKQMNELLKTLNTPLLINNNVDIALAIDADGVHLGNEDLPVNVARELLGSDKVIGKSVGNLQETLEAQEQGANYLGLGPVFPTTTKEGAEEELCATTIKSIFEKVDLPIVGIGGINEDNIDAICHYPWDGIAVVSAIMSQDDKFLAAKKLKNKTNTLLTAGDFHE